MKTINILLTEMANEKEVLHIPKKDPEWGKAKDKCLVEILKKMNEAKK